MQHNCFGKDTELREMCCAGVRHLGTTEQHTMAKLAFFKSVCMYSPSTLSIHEKHTQFVMSYVGSTISSCKTAPNIIDTRPRERPKQVFCMHSS